MVNSFDYELVKAALNERRGEIRLHNYLSNNLRGLNYLLYLLGL